MKKYRHIATLSERKLNQKTHLLHDHSPKTHLPKTYLNQAHQTTGTHHGMTL
jgi:hypothetical protein